MIVTSRALLLLVGTLAAASALSTVAPAHPASTGSKLLKSGGDESAWVRSFSNAQECPPTQMEMEVPADFPVGTYYRNGGGRYVAKDGTRTMHPFDADGFVSAVTFNEDGKVFFRTRFVQTDEFKKDEEIGGFSARGVFGTPKSGGLLSNAFDMKTKNVANTNVLRCGDKLMTLWEGGTPYELDPKTLKTIRKMDDIDVPFSAHPRYDPKKNVWVNHGVTDPDPVSGLTYIHLTEMDADTGAITSKSVSLKVPGVALMHDSALTENYVVLSWNKCDLDSTGGVKALLGIGPFAGALALDEVGKHVILCIPRTLFETGGEAIDALEDERIKQIESDFSFAFHFGNAYEDDQGQLIFDRVETDDRKFDFGMKMMSDLKGEPLMSMDGVPFDNMEPYKVVRYQIDLEKQSLVERKELCGTGSMEFPTIPSKLSTQQHQFLYLAASHDPLAETYGFQGSFCKMDACSGEILESFISEPYEIVAEPCLIPKVNAKDEDDAYLMAFVVNGRDLTTDFVLLDAKTMNVVTRSMLPSFVPNGGLHGRYVEGDTFDF